MQNLQGLHVMKKILVIQNKRIGDVLIASTIANNMKKCFPESRIDYLVYDYTTGVIENNPNIDRILAVEEKELKKIGNLLLTIKQVRNEQYDIIFDPYAKLQSRLICLFSGTKIRIGTKKRDKNPFLPFYTHYIKLLKKRTKNCGKAIEDRLNMMTSVFDFSAIAIDPEPHIYLTKEEQAYNKLDSYHKPFIMLGILGSTPQKSMPYPYIVSLINTITSTYNVNVLFNYAPHQKEEALKIYEDCTDKEAIVLDIYEDSIRGFITLMNKCAVLVGNEGGIVHIAKALDKSTFTIFSPYVMKDHWASFEDGKKHTSIHLLEEQPNLFDAFSVEERRKIEENPQELYNKLTPELILTKLLPFLDLHLSQTKK